MKIHKLKPEEIVPNCDIPVRLITCLQDGASKRSDVYIAEKWLKGLEKDYCKDLLKDTTEALVWLEAMNDKGKELRRNLNPFTFDFEALYDSLNPELVFDAIEDAMDVCREDWSYEFKCWLLDLVKLSIDSAVGEFQTKFYKPKGGLPTGGSLSVEVANITVFCSEKSTV